MTKADVVASVGQSRYGAASEILKKIVPGPDPDLPHDVSPAVWDALLSQVDKIELFFELYDDLPSYGMLMYATHAYRDFDDHARAHWWRNYFTRLGGSDEVIQEPLLYALWCDYFEDGELVADVWERVAIQSDPRIIEAILPASGPVPWALKSPLYETAARNTLFHEALLRALVGSAFDVYGHIDLDAARQLLARLQVKEDAQGYVELRERLAG